MLSFMKPLSNFKKWVISKKSYLILKVIYLIACLSGLGFQVVQISTNYFNYDVVSTIKIKLPGEESARAINMCLDLYNSVDHGLLEKFRKERIEILERKIRELAKKKRTTGAPGTLTTNSTTSRTDPRPSHAPRTTTIRSTTMRTTQNWTTGTKKPTTPSTDDNDDSDFGLGSLFDADTLIKKTKIRQRRAAPEMPTELDDLKKRKNLNQWTPYLIRNFLTLGDLLKMTTWEGRCLSNNETKDIDRTDPIEIPCSGNKFIVNNEICFRLVPNSWPLVNKETDLFGGDNFPLFIAKFDPKTRANDSKVFLNTVMKLPRNEYVQAQKFRLDSEAIDVSAFSYNITRQQAPYKDNCMKYEPLFSDWNDAIASCINTKTLKEIHRLSAFKMFDERFNSSKDMIQNFTDKGGKFQESNASDYQRQFTQECKGIYKKPDCFIENSMTLLTSKLTRSKPIGYQNPKRDILVSQVFSDDASYSIQSSPKFEFVDYVSFVFGCLGTWLGFSFLGINPIPILFTTTELNIPSIIPDKMRRKSLPHSIVFTTGRFVLMLHRKIELERKRNENERRRNEDERRRNEDERKVIESKLVRCNMERTNMKRKLDSLEMDLERRFVERYRSLKQEIALLSTHNMMNRDT